MPPPIDIQTLTGIGDQSHLDWSAIIFSEGDWRDSVQLRPEFAALAAAGSLTGLLAMRAYKAIKSFLCKIMGDKRLPSAEAFVYEGCLFVDAAGNLWMMKRLKNKATSEITGAQLELIGHIERKQKNVKLPGQESYNARPSLVGCVEGCVSCALYTTSRCWAPAGTPPAGPTLGRLPAWSDRSAADRAPIGYQFSFLISPHSIPKKWMEGAIYT